MAEEQATEFGFSYEYGVDIKDSTSQEWIPFRFPSGITVSVEAVTKDAATYDDLGSPHDVKLSESWSISFNVQQHRLADGKYLPEVEALMLLTKPDAVGNRAVGTFRWYDKPAEETANKDDAYEGEATVTMNRAETANDGIGAWSVTLNGVGRRRQIENPWKGWSETSELGG